MKKVNGQIIIYGKKGHAEVNGLTGQTLGEGIIIGSEGKGVRKLIKEKSDFLISIPTTNKLDSLNASVSAGILFYEIFKAANKG